MFSSSYFSWILMQFQYFSRPWYYKMCLSHLCRLANPGYIKKRKNNNNIVLTFHGLSSEQGSELSLVACSTLCHHAPQRHLWQTQDSQGLGHLALLHRLVHGSQAQGHWKGTNTQLNQQYHWGVHSTSKCIGALVAIQAYQGMFREC